nr:hypothetical protein [Duganella radicis]
MASGALDGSVAQATGLLRELIALTGQVAGTVPVLELQLGEVLTRTTVQVADGHHLLITAVLPRDEDAGQALQAGAAAEAEIEYLWHADEGRHIGLRRVALATLADERGLMDAILETADLAAAWLERRRGGA